MTEANLSNTQPRRMRSAAGGRTNGWGRIQQILRKLLLSEYFVLYLSIIYFLVLWPFIPRIASPQNLGNIFSNMWPLLAVAIGQTFVLIVAGIDLSQSAIIALVSVIGAAIMTTQLDPVLFEKSPLWGIFVTETGESVGRIVAGTAGGVGRHAWCRCPDRAVERHRCC